MSLCKITYILLASKNIQSIRGCQVALKARDQGRSCGIKNKGIVARKKEVQYTNGYRRQLAWSHKQLRGNNKGERGPITHQGAKDSNSNIEKWAARLTVTNEAYIKSNQSQQGGHTQNISKSNLLSYLYFSVPCNLGVVSK